MPGGPLLDVIFVDWQLQQLAVCAKAVLGMGSHSSLPSVSSMIWEMIWPLASQARSLQLVSSLITTSSWMSCSPARQDFQTNAWQRSGQFKQIHNSFVSSMKWIEMVYFYVFCWSYDHSDHSWTMTCLAKTAKIPLSADIGIMIAAFVGQVHQVP